MSRIIGWVKIPRPPLTKLRCAKIIQNTAKRIKVQHISNIKNYEKKDVNQDSHIACSPISQSSFLKGVRCLISASSQRKLRVYIEFL